MSLNNQALQASGEYEGAHELCLMAQAVVEQSVEKGKGMGPAHDPHVLWLQLAHSSFFLQKWDDALQFFTRIVLGVKQVCDRDERSMTGICSAYAAASMCGVQPICQDEVHRLLLSACGSMKELEALGSTVKEHPVLKGRLRAHAARGPPGSELWLFELLYLHNASAANGMPEAWHQGMLELLQETPIAAMSQAFEMENIRWIPSEADAVMAHKFMKVLLTESRFVLPHALYLTAVLSYRLRPVGEQLYISHSLCVRAKRIRDYDFDCQV
ncbi:unnamed protein product, partial [Choristocarpus tenellus]